MSEFDVLSAYDDRGWNTDEKCPWCGKPIDTLYEHFRDEYVTFDCGHCEKPIEGHAWTQFILQRPKDKAASS